VPLFAILWTLFLVALVGVGLSAGASLAAFAAVLLYSHRRSQRGVAVALAGALVALAMAGVVLAATWRYAAWLLPPLFAEYRRFAAEQAEKPTLDPALEEVHRFVQAEAAYHAANHFFDTPACLARPAGCIPGYSGPPFLDGELQAGTRGGFDWSFHPGPAPRDLAARTGASPSSVSTYAVLAVPAAGGARSVCGDYRGVCTFVGTRLGDGGACPADCIRHTWTEDGGRPPLLVGFTPARGRPGTMVTVTGANLLGWSGVEWRFGGVLQPESQSSDDEARLPVPEGAKSGRISVTTPAGTAQSADEFIVEGAPPASPSPR
jgi:hypothetical protein